MFQKRKYKDFKKSSFQIPIHFIKLVLKQDFNPLYF